VEVRFHGRGKNEASHYCGQCEVRMIVMVTSSRPELTLCIPQIEVFNVLFIREQEKRHVVHCMDCARKQAPNLDGFVCLEEYRLEELMDVYNNFMLHPTPAVVMVSACSTILLIKDTKFSTSFQTKSIPSKLLVISLQAFFLKVNNCKAMRLGMKILVSDV
jgi:hypothetical protein